MSDLGPGERFGEFELLSMLGEGGMGQVFRARPRDGGEVALKILRPQLGADPSYRRRFEREAELAMRMDHRHLVSTTSRGEVDGRLYITQEYVEGGSLADRIRSRERLDPAEAVRLCLEIAAGLDAIHEAGLVHRDVKPQNVLLDVEGRALITDFGLAKDHAASTVLTRLGQTLGSIDYMAPEQIRNAAEIDRRADIYSLGCVVYECLSGSPPFHAYEGMRVMWAHMQEDPPPLEEARPELGERVAWAVGIGLSKDPEKRPPTATAFARMLQLAWDPGGEGGEN